MPSPFTGRRWRPATRAVNSVFTAHVLSSKTFLCIRGFRRTCLSGLILAFVLQRVDGLGFLVYIFEGLTIVGLTRIYGVLGWMQGSFSPGFRKFQYVGHPKSN